MRQPPEVEYHSRKTESRKQRQSKTTTPKEHQESLHPQTSKEYPYPALSHIRPSCHHPLQLFTRHHRQYAIPNTMLISFPLPPCRSRFRSNILAPSGLARDLGITHIIMIRATLNRTFRTRQSTARNLGA